MKKLIVISLACILSLTVNLRTEKQKFHGDGDGHGHGIHKTNYDSLYEAAIPLDESSEGQALVDACIEKYGGYDALEKLKRLRVVYQLIAQPGDDTIKITKTRAFDRKHKISRDGDAGFEERIINGDKAWYRGRDMLVELKSGRYKSEYFSYLTMIMPFGMKSESFTGIRFGRRYNDSLNYIYMQKKDTLMIVLGIDPAQHTIKSSEGIIFWETGTFVYVNYFSDFEVHEAYLYPNTLVNISMGMEVGRSKLIELNINPKLEEGYFLPSKDSDNIGW